VAYLAGGSTDSGSSTVEFRKGQAGKAQETLSVRVPGGYFMDGELASSPYQHQAPPVKRRSAALVASAYGDDQPTMAAAAEALSSAVLPKPPSPPSSSQLPEFSGTSFVSSSHAAAELGRMGGPIGGRIGGRMGDRKGKAAGGRKGDRKAKAAGGRKGGRMGDRKAKAAGGRKGGRMGDRKAKAAGGRKGGQGARIRGLPPGTILGACTKCGRLGQRGKQHSPGGKYCGMYNLH
jgi:hypothetical protein